jgi:transposase
MSMGNPRGVSRDFEALEARRMKAVALFREGLNNSEIGRQLQVANQTVSRWRKEYQEGGKKALSKAGRAGRMPQLDADQYRRLVDCLLAGPAKLGYETPLWTCQRVADLIEQEFNVRYHPGHVWKILRGLNWSPQRPVGRALERNEAAIREWKQHTWPAAKKKPGKKAVRSSSSTKVG